MLPEIQPAFQPLDLLNLLKPLYFRDITKIGMPVAFPQSKSTDKVEYAKVQNDGKGS